MAAVVAVIALGPGPLGFFLSAELVGQRGRSAAQALTSFSLMARFSNFYLF
jgi:hypothetical protein